MSTFLTFLNLEKIFFNLTVQNVYSLLKQDLPNLIGIGCPAHILNNCVHHSTDQLSIDIECILFKIYQHFSIYAVRTEELKSFCQFVEIEYKKVLSHSKTRFLSLGPHLTRVLEILPAFIAYFNSISKPPAVIAKFFKNPLHYLYLLFLDSFLTVFHEGIQKIEKEKISVVEMSLSLNNIFEILEHRRKHLFLNTKIKSELKKLEHQGYGKEIEVFMKDVGLMYECSIEYLEKWSASFRDFKVLNWMELGSPSEWDEVQQSLTFLSDRGVNLDEEKLFDEYCGLSRFVTKEATDPVYINLMAHERWAKYFKACGQIFPVQLQTVAQFYFSIMPHNANVERVFSMMVTQWSDERDNLKVETVESILQVQYNWKDLTCSDFYNLCIDDSKLLKQIKSNEKYTNSKLSNSTDI